MKLKCFNYIGNSTYSAILKKLLSQKLWEEFIVFLLVFSKFQLCSVVPFMQTHLAEICIYLLLPHCSVKVTSACSCLYICFLLSQTFLMERSWLRISNNTKNLQGILRYLIFTVKHAANKTEELGNVTQTPFVRQQQLVPLFRIRQDVKNAEKICGPRSECRFYGCASMKHYMYKRGGTLPHNSPNAVAKIDFNQGIVQ